MKYDIWINTYIQSFFLESGTHFKSTDEDLDFLLAESVDMLVGPVDESC
jgi:hypothetical protein